MRYGTFLPEKGCVGFVAPSFGCNIEPYYSAFKNTQKKLTDSGRQYKSGPNVYAGDGIGISSSPERCAAEFMQAYLDPDCDMLMSCGGGELMCTILPHIDFAVLAEAEPKWFMGYSDNTNLTFLLPTLTDTAAIYGPNAPAFGMEPWHESITMAADLITGRSATVHSFDAYEIEGLKDEEHPLMPYNPTEPRVLRIYDPGKAEDPENGTVTATADTSLHFSGRLLGGCLDILTNLCGTKYDAVSAFRKRYAEDGIIWFLEACDLNVLDIRRAIWHLDQAGWFENTRGFLIGRPLNGQEIMGVDQYRAVTEELAKYKVPILMDLDIGHIPPMMPLVCGAMADVTVRGNDVEIVHRFL